MFVSKSDVFELLPDFLVPAFSDIVGSPFLTFFVVLLIGMIQVEYFGGEAFID